MNDAKNLLDRQLSRVEWTQGDRQTVLCAVRKEKSVMKKKLITLLAAALLLAMLTGAAVAATMLWGVEDFAARSGMPLPDAPVQQEIPQQGGEGTQMTVRVTDAVWDGETVCITLHCQPNMPGTLLMEACLSPDMPLRNLDRQLAGEGAIADFAAQRGFSDLLGVEIEPMLNGEYIGCRASWHLEESGGYTLFYEFDGVADGPLTIDFQCVTWGWDEARGSFCDDSRCEVIDLACTLTAPEAP